MTRRAAAFAVLVAVSLVLVPAGARAQSGLLESLKAILDTNFSSITTTTTEASGASTTTTSNSLNPRLTLTADTLLYPSLRLNLGGVFESNKLFAADNVVDGDATITRLRPYAELRSVNPIFAPGVAYYRRESRTRFGASPTVSLIGEDYAGYLAWKPVGLPLMDFQFIRTNTFDGNRVVRDSTNDFGSILSRYSYQGVNLHYQGTFLETTDRRLALETRQVSNAGRVDHSKTLFNRRLLWNATYNINHQTFTAASTVAGGEVALPVTPFAGLSVISDLVLTVPLTQNPQLVDGNLMAGAGLDLGVPGLGADTQARNMGLDLLTPTAVDRLLVWVDRELPVEIARTFSWEVYSSADNLVWRRESAVPTAPFGPFENRFQLDFDPVTARYLKVVTRPLSGTVPDATRFPDILVTELQAFATRAAGEGRDTTERTNQNLNADLRFRILDAPTLYYEGSYWRNTVGPTGPRWDTLSNGLSVSHRFTRVLAAYGRGAYEQGTQPDGDRTATVSNASLTLDPIQTLTSSLLYTGLDERIGGRPSDRRSVLVQSNAQLYRGVDVQFGFGWSFNNRETGERLRDRLLNLTASVVPRQNVTLTLNYVDTTTTRSGTFSGDPRYHTRRGYLTLAFDPIRTLHLVLGQEVLVTSNEKTRVTHNIGANWSPFPDGALQFLVAYNDYLRPEEFGTERYFRTGVRWMFSRQSFVDVSYQRTRSQYVFLDTASRTFGIDLRLFL